MTLGSSLFNARKKSGFSQEQVAEKLGISRQTVSKWETDETLPDIRQAKKLSSLYGISLDELIEFDADVKEIERIIENTSQKVQDKVDWTKLWGKKYPVLTQYQDDVDIAFYSYELKKLLAQLRADYGYSELDALLVLKDILGHCWKSRK